MSLYDATWTYLASLPGVQEWDELRGLLDRVTHKRPRHWRLPVLACTASGGAPQQAIPAVAALGCLYLAIVLVDDMLDADPKGQHHTLGYPATANLAGALQALGSAAIIHSSAAPLIQAAMLDRLNHMLLLTALGQYWDTQNPRDEEAYWRVTRAKSSPFFGAALYVGALCGDVTAATATQLGEVGEIYGEMIQVNDDLNDVLETPANADWQQGRFPLPILFADLVPHPDRERFRRLRGQVAQEEALREAQDILIRCGAVSYAVDQLLQRHTKAVELLDATALAQQGIIRQRLDEVVAPAHRLLDLVSAPYPT